jgi:hypothetical protein
VIADQDDALVMGNQSRDINDEITQSSAHGHIGIITLSLPMATIFQALDPCRVGAIAKGQSTNCHYFY